MVKMVCAAVRRDGGSLLALSLLLLLLLLLLRGWSGSGVICWVGVELSSSMAIFGNFLFLFFCFI